MDLEQALAVFRELEAHRYAADDVMDGEEPIFDVRLDAMTTRDEHRAFRVRVTTGAIPEVTGETWQMVLDAAGDGMSVAVQNSGMELS